MSSPPRPAGDGSSVAETLAALRDLDRETVDRVLSLIEARDEHRRRVEWRRLTVDGWRLWLGMGTGFVIALAGLAVAAVTTIFGPPTGGSIVGGVVGTVDLTSLVALFVLGQRRD